MSFERFWSAYPRHVSKGAAIKSWEKISPDEEMTNRIILAIQAQKSYRWKVEEMNASLPERQKRFVPDWKHPATWLNQSCWDDEIPSIVQTRIEATREAETCECGKPAFNRKHCSRCYSKLANPSFADEVKQHLKQMGFTKEKGESWRNASFKCLKMNGLFNKIPSSVEINRSSDRD